MTAAMQSQEALSAMFQGLHGGDKTKWMEDNGIDTEVMAYLVGTIEQAFVMLVATGENPQDAVRAFIAYSFQIGWEAHAAE